MTTKTHNGLGLGAPHCSEDLANDYRDMIEYWKVLPPHHKSVKKFAEIIPEETLRGFMEKAFFRCDHPDDGFRYFCGCCWNKMKPIHRILPND